MGDYSYSEHIEIFGGPPEPGEAYPDLEQVDLARKEQKENPPPAAVGPRPCPFYVITGEGERRYCDQDKGHYGTHCGNRTEAEYLAALGGSS